MLPHKSAPSVTSLGLLSVLCPGSLILDISSKHPHPQQANNQSYEYMAGANDFVDKYV